MSDMRFVVAGVALSFGALVALGALGPSYAAMAIQAGSFEQCVEYGEGISDPIDCNEALARGAWAVAVPVALLGAAAYALARGWRGTWDQDVPEGEMAGPARRGG